MKLISLFEYCLCPLYFTLPLAMCSWLKISPQCYFNVIYLIVTACQWSISFPYTPCIPMQIKPIKACQGKGWGALPLREWLSHPFSSTGLSSPCEFVLSQPQRHGHCLPVSTSNLFWHVIIKIHIWSLSPVSNTELPKSL